MRRDFRSFQRFRQILGCIALTSGSMTRGADALRRRVRLTTAARKQLPERENRSIPPTHQPPNSQGSAGNLDAGGSVDFAIATAVELDGSSVDLRLKSARRLAENAAVVSAQLSQRTAVLNIDADLTEAGGAEADA